tara:strand:+ start:1931 stop:2572 length:642 start_codon:yes stop_codon:yes gene_type:complete
MEKFANIQGIAATLILDNIDTDAILPSRFLTKTTQTGKSGFGQFLFADWKKNKEGTTEDFILNKPKYKASKILIAGKNFGCGSSREHAVWALLGFGIKSVIASSFGEIFYNNCFKNGLLPITLDNNIIQSLSNRINTESNNSFVTIDLLTNSIKLESGITFEFSIDKKRKNMLINGLDEISLTLKSKEKISSWQDQDKKKRPWVYKINQNIND